MTILVSPDTYIINNGTLVNGLVLGATQIGITLPNMRFGAFYVTAEAYNITGTLGAGAHISVGTNSTSYNNILATTTLTALTNNQLNVTPMANSILSVAPNTPIFVNVVTAGTTATVYKLMISLVGVYF